MANLILNWILLQNNYAFASIEEDQNSKNEYLSILEESQAKNDKSIFINYILRIEKESLNRALQIITQ